MLSESLLLRGSRTLLLKKCAFCSVSKCLTTLPDGNAPQSQPWQHRPKQNWSRLVSTAARRRDGISSSAQKLPSPSKSAPSPEGRRQARGDASQQSGPGDSGVLWPVRYILDRLFAQQKRQQDESSSSGSSPRVDVASGPGQSLQRIAARRRQAANASEVAPSTAQLDTQSGKGDGFVARTDGSGNGTEDSTAANGRSMQQLTAAAEWQLQRAYAELRRAAEVKKGQEDAASEASSSTDTGQNGSGTAAAGAAADASTPASGGNGSGGDGSDDNGIGNAAVADGSRSDNADQLQNVQQAKLVADSTQWSGGNGSSAAVGHAAQSANDAPASTDAAAAFGTTAAPPETETERQQRKKQQRLDQEDSELRKKDRSGGWVRLPHLPSLRRRREKGPPDLPPVQLAHPAVQLAWRRAKAGSQPGQRTDNAKLGLVVEGGGLRGCISAGSLMELYRLGLKDSFDAVYGASAGAISATYFLTGQREGVDIYIEDISNKTFCDLGRLVGRGAGPMLNLSFLIDHIMMEVKPLRWDDVIKSRVPLKVVASCLDTLRPVLLQDFVDREDLATCLRASANIPVVAGRPMVHRGRRLVDGAVFEGIPFRQAIADGCTHVVVLCTRPPFRGGRMQKAVTDLLSAGVKRGFLNPDYMRPAWRAELDQITEEQMTADEMLMLALKRGSQELPAFYNTFVAPLYPAQSCNISPVCIDPETLRGGVAEGRRIVATTFDPEDQGMPAEVAARLAPDVRAALKAAGPLLSPSTAGAPVEL